MWHYKLHLLEVYLSVLRNEYESLLSLITLKWPFISFILNDVQVQFLVQISLLTMTFASNS